jgi:parvulin-like peptidyl-prolyl isomerase
MKKNRISFLLGAVLLALAAGCPIINPSREYVAAVDGEKIYLDEYNDRFRMYLSMTGNPSLDAAETERLRREFLNQLIDEKLMISRAAKLGLTVSDGELEKRIEDIRADYKNEEFQEIFRGKGEFKIWKEDLRKRILFEKLIEREVNAAVSVSDDEVLRYYRSHPEERTVPERVRVSQIVLPDRERAEEALEKIHAGEDFGKTAREMSIGPERSRDGDLGYFERGVLPETFDRVIFSLRPGMTSRVVETPYGFHIFKVQERFKGGKAGFSEVKEKIRSKLKGRKEEAEYGKWLEGLRAKASIAVNEAALVRTDPGSGK